MQVLHEFQALVASNPSLAPQGRRISDFVTLIRNYGSVLDSEVLRGSTIAMLKLIGLCPAQDPTAEAMQLHLDSGFRKPLDLIGALGKPVKADQVVAVGEGGVGNVTLSAGCSGFVDKVLRGGILEKATFFREMMFAAQPVCPKGAVPIVDFSAPGGSPSLRMLNFGAGSVRDFIRRRVLGDNRLGVVLALGEGMMASVAESHKRHIIHRDVKPDNFLVFCGSEVYVTDFGMAQTQQEAQNDRVSFSGSPYYWPNYWVSEPIPDNHAKTMERAMWMATHRKPGATYSLHTDMYALACAIGVLLYKPDCEFRSYAERDAFVLGIMNDTPQRGLPAKVQRVLKRGMMPLGEGYETVGDMLAHYRTETQRDRFVSLAI